MSPYSWNLVIEDQPRGRAAETRSCLGKDGAYLVDVVGAEYTDRSATTGTKKVSTVWRDNAVFPKEWDVSVIDVDPKLPKNTPDIATAPFQIEELKTFADSGKTKLIFRFGDSATAIGAGKGAFWREVEKQRGSAVSWFRISHRSNDQRPTLPFLGGKLSNYAMRKEIAELLQEQGTSYFFTGAASDCFARTDKTRIQNRHPKSRISQAQIDSAKSSPHPMRWTRGPSNLSPAPMTSAWTNHNKTAALRSDLQWDSPKLQTPKDTQAEVSDDGWTTVPRRSGKGSTAPGIKSSVQQTAGITKSLLGASNTGARSQISPVEHESPAETLPAKTWSSIASSGPSPALVRSAQFPALPSSSSTISAKAERSELSPWSIAHEPKPKRQDQDTANQTLESSREFKKDRQRHPLENWDEQGGDSLVELGEASHVSAPGYKESLESLTGTGPKFDPGTSRSPAVQTRFIPAQATSLSNAIPRHRTSHSVVSAEVRTKERLDYAEMLAEMKNLVPGFSEKLENRQNQLETTGSSNKGKSLRLDYASDSAGMNTERGVRYSPSATRSESMSANLNPVGRSTQSAVMGIQNNLSNLENLLSWTYKRSDWAEETENGDEDEDEQRVSPEVENSCIVPGQSTEVGSETPQMSDKIDTERGETREREIVPWWLIPEQILFAEIVDDAVRDIAAQHSMTEEEFEELASQDLSFEGMMLAAWLLRRGKEAGQSIRSYSSAHPIE